MYRQENEDNILEYILQNFYKIGGYDMKNFISKRDFKVKNDVKGYYTDCASGQCATSCSADCSIACAYSCATSCNNFCRAVLMF